MVYFSFVLSFYFQFGQKLRSYLLFLIALILPIELLSLTSFNEVAQLTLGLLLTYLLIGGYLLYVVKKEKRKGMLTDEDVQSKCCVFESESIPNHDRVIEFFYRFTASVAI